MNLNKNIQVNAFMANDPFSSTFPDSFEGAGLKNIYLPDFTNQRITIMVSLSGLELNNISNKISGTIANGALRYLNALILPNVSVTENFDIVYSIDGNSFVNNYNIDNPEDPGIIRSGDLNITIDPRSDVQEINYIITGIFSTIGTAGNLVLDINEPFSIIPVNNTEIVLDNKIPNTGDIISSLKFNKFINTIQLFSTNDKYISPIIHKTQFGTNIKLQANDIEGTAYFGKSVYKTDRFVIVGAPVKDSDGITDTGKVYIYDLEKNIELQLTSSDAEASDQYGIAISFDEYTNILAVGAYLEDDTATSSGSVYLYDLSIFNSEAIINSEIKIQSSDITASDYFGLDLSIDNGVLAIAAKANNELATDTGAIYLYDVTNFDKISIMDSEIKIQASNAGYGDFFGYSVILKDTKLAVSAYSEDTTASAAGAVYIYDISKFDNDSIRTSEIFLQSSDIQDSAHFGSDLDINNNILVIGTSLMNTVSGSDAGSVYLYDLNNFDEESIKNSEIIIHASDGAALDYFGFSVSLSNNILYVGAYGEDTIGATAGKVYIYDITSKEPITISESEIKIQADDIQSGDSFGYSLDSYDNTFVVGSYLEDTFISNAGSVYVYDMDIIKANLK